MALSSKGPPSARGGLDEVGTARSFEDEGPKTCALECTREPPHVRLWNYVSSSATYYVDNPAAVKSELLSGITISILKVPESVAFSYVAGVHPLQGLYGSFFMGILTGFLGGRPGMISGCAGALAVVIKDIMDDAGPFPDECPEKRREYLFFTMVLTGLLQLVCGTCRCAVLVKLIPKTAFLGFFNGLAIVIFMSQLTTFKKPGSLAGSAGCIAVDFGFQEDQEWYKLDERTTWLMLVHIAIVMFTMEMMPRLPKIPLGPVGKVSPARVVPPALLGLLLTMALEWGVIRPMDCYTPVVKDVSRIKGELPPFHIPDVPWGEWNTWKKCFPCAASLCAIGLVESVLTLQAVDQILDESTSVPMKNQECLAQGLANLSSGFFSAMGGDAMIGQSMINVLNGAQGRLSAVTDACFLLVYIVSLSAFIEAIPTAGLAGILFIVVIHTFNWPSLAIIARRALPLYMCATIVIVTVLSVLTNLAIGIGVGILWECVWYAWREGEELTVHVTKSEKEKIYRIAGNVFFANANDFSAYFTPTMDPPLVTCDLANARLLDHSALFDLNQLGRRFELAGREFKIDMKQEDYARYLAVCDELDPNTEDKADCLRGRLRTCVVKSIEGKVHLRELQDFRYQEFHSAPLVASAESPLAQHPSTACAGVQAKESTRENVLNVPEERVQSKRSSLGDGHVRLSSKDAWKPRKSPLENSFGKEIECLRSSSKDCGPPSKQSSEKAVASGPCLLRCHPVEPPSPKQTPAAKTLSPPGSPREPSPEMALSLEDHPLGVPIEIDTLMRPMLPRSDSMTSGEEWV